MAFGSCSCIAVKEGVLVQGKKAAKRILLTLAGWAGTAVVPGTAQAAWGNENWGEMVWGAQAPPTLVPALGEWGLVLPLVLALLGFGLLVRRRGHRNLAVSVSRRSRRL